MGPGEFVLGLLAESVVPDDPVSQVKAQFLADNPNMGGVFVPDGDIKGPRRLEHIHTCLHPVPRPVNVFVLLELVLVLVVLIPDIKRRVREHQVRKRLAHTR